MAGALSGIRIVDLTTVISGPVTTQILADQGAEVIKIEAPAGDLTRRIVAGRQKVAPPFISSNRNKKSVVLDLKTRPALDAVLALVRTADVFIENFRPGTAARMGLGADVLRAINPRLIYVSINGFGDTGPYAHKRVYDPIVQATSGLAGLQADPADNTPRMVQFVLADKVTALTAAQAITAAIVARHRTGEGQTIKVSMLDAMLAFLWPSAMGSLTLADADQPKMLRGSKVFRTLDGYITASANSEGEWQGLCAALERPAWREDARFATAGTRAAHSTQLVDAMQEALAGRTSAEWLDLLDRNDVPCAPVLDLPDLLTDPQIAHSGSIETFSHPEWGTVRQARPAARFSGTPSEIRTLAPTLGQHNDEVLGALEEQKSTQGWP
jgi:crotonobetainyl-CoA:carnitine CoA-transferase CaiB-like acyl-CoA transferase